LESAARSAYGHDIPESVRLDVERRAASSQERWFGNIA
jgi:hypothetical protein